MLRRVQENALSPKNVAVFLIALCAPVNQGACSVRYVFRPFISMLSRKVNVLKIRTQYYSFVLCHRYCNAFV